MAQNIGFLNFGIDGDDKAIKAKLEAIKKDAISIESVMKNIKLDGGGSNISKDLQKAQLNADKLVISNNKVAQSNADMKRSNERLNNELKRGTEIESRKAVNSLRYATEKKRQDEISLNMEIRKQRVSNVTAESTARKMAVEKKMQEQSLINEARLEGIRKRNAKVSTRGQDEFRRSVERSNKSLRSQNTILGSIEKRLIGAFSGYQLARFAKEIINVRGEFQGLELAFTTMLGSAEKSQKMMVDVASLALKTPYTISEVAGNTKQLIAMGIQAEKVMDTMKALGDVSAGLSVPMWRIAINYGQVSALGRLQAREIRDFAMAGVPIVDELAKQLGKTTSEITDMVTAGKIGFPEVEKAFQSMAGEGGKFHNMMEKQNSTVKGQMNRLEDQVELMMNSIGKSNEGIIYSTIGMTSSLVENYEKVGKSIVSLIALYGAYRVAVSIAVASSKGWTIAEMAIYRVWKAQKLLNATMLKNPYVLVATMAVGAITAMWALHDSTTSAERAQRDFNDSHDRYKAGLEEEIATTNKLIGVIKDKESLDTRKASSVKALVQVYPELLIKYRNEFNVLKNILDVEKEIQGIRSNRSRAFNEMEYEKYSKLADEQQTKVWKAGSRASDSMKEKLDDLKNRSNLALQAVSNDISDAFLGELSTMSDKRLDEYINLLTQKVKGGADKVKLELGTNQAFYKTGTYSLEETRGLLDSAKSAKESRNVGTINDEITSTKANIEELKKDLNSLQSGIRPEGDKRNYGFKFSKAIADKKKEIKDAEDRLSVLLNEDEPKKISAENKDKELKKITDFNNLKSSIELDAEKRLIDIKKDGFEKRIALIRFENKKELSELEKNKKDYLDRKIDLEKSKFENNKANKGKSFNPSNVRLDKDEVSMFNDLGLAINNKRIADIANVYTELLSKYKGYTEKRLEIQRKYQTDRESLIKAGASKESLDENKYQEKDALEAIDNEFAMREDSFKDWIDGIADIGIEKLREKLVEAKKELERMEFLTPNNPKLAIQRAKVDKLEKLTDKPELKTSPGKRSIKEWGDLYKVLNKVGRQFEEIGDSIGGTTGKILKGAGGISVATTQMVSSIIMVGKGSVEAMVGASTAAAAAIKTVEKASVILAIIGAALQIATKITDMFAADYSKYEKAKENYESYVEVLDQVIDKQKELIETMTGQAAVEASNRARELVEKQVEAARKIGRERLDVGASIGSHSIGVRQRKKMDDSDWADVREAIGYNASVEKGRMHGLFDLSVEQLESLKEKAPAFWGKLDDDVRAYLEQIIKGKESIKDINDAINESFTQVSFESFRDEFLDTLMDMDIGVKEFADNFGEQMTKALLNLSMGEVIEDDLRKLYDAWSKDLQNSNGELSKEQISQYKKEYEDMIKKMFAEREKIFELTGYTDGGSSKSTLSKGIQEVTEDTASLLASYINSIRSDSSVSKENLIKMVQIAQLNQKSLGGMLAQLLLIQVNTLNTANNTSKTADVVERTYDLLKSVTTPGGATAWNMQ